MHPCADEKYPWLVSAGGTFVVFSGGGGGGMVVAKAEEQGDAPETGQTHKCVDNAGEDGKLAAEEEGHGVKSEQADAAPVERANDGNQDCNFIKHTRNLHSARRLGYG